MVCYVNGGRVREGKGGMIYSVESLVAGKELARGRRGGMWLTWWGGMKGANDGREKRKRGEGRERKLTAAWRRGGS